VDEKENRPYTIFAPYNKRIINTDIPKP